MDTYEKKYNEALERCRKLYNEAKAHEYNQDLEDYEIIFPELKESEDERIRKDLIAIFKGEIPYTSEENRKRYIAWLKKQGNEKPATIDIDKMVYDYANNKERGNEEFGKPLECMIRAYRQGLNDAIGKVVLKPTWSKDDENVLEDIEEAIINYWHGDTQDILLDWLKSIKQRIKGE